MASTQPPIRLTARERQLVAALLDGCRNREIAQKHGVCEQTVKNQLKTLFRKVQVSSRLELAVRVVTGAVNIGDGNS